MKPNDRLHTISYLLNTALDSEEEYLYHGEMSDYMRSYAGDAAAELDSLFRASAPTPTEIEYCVAALSDPERIRRDRSAKLLLALRDRSRPILDALAKSPDPQLRIFALETGNISLNPYFFNPLYGSIELKRRLLNDPDEAVRACALSSAQATIVHNAVYLATSLRSGAGTPLLDFLFQIAGLLDDPSPEVRAEAARVVRRWADEVSQETLDQFLEHANNPAARELLARTRAPGDTAKREDVE